MSELASQPSTQGEVAEGPYFDELSVGQVFGGAPGVTLTSGLAAARQSVVGERLAMVLDAPLCAEVTGSEPMAPPGLVWDVAIGQSTVVTQHVRANLFYRGLAFRRVPALGDTLRTTTSVVALRRNRPRAGRRPTGLAVLRIRTEDQDERPVLDFWRCAMLPLRGKGDGGPVDDLETVGAPPNRVALAAVVGGWRLDALARRMPGIRAVDLAPGQVFRIDGGSVVSSAPELARLTTNVAAVHHDATAAGGHRLVYGGHTIGIALSQATRALPTIATVVGWHGCDHVGPVHEGDTLRSTVHVEAVEPLAGGGALVDLRSIVHADGDPARDVLDWRYVVAMP